MNIYKTCASKLIDVIEIKRGVLFDKGLLTTNKTTNNSFRYFEGNVYRYQTQSHSPNWIEYGIKMKEYPKEFKWFEGPRILLRRLVNRKQQLMASYIEETVITNKNLYTILPRDNVNLFLILGVLNSKLISKLYLSMVSQSTKDDFPQVTINDIGKLPIPDINNYIGKPKYNKVVELTKFMLDLNRRLQAAKAPEERRVLERQIAGTDRAIDELVYELYGLTEEEIRIVEGGS